MKKQFILCVSFMFFVSFISLDAQWVRTYGGSGEDYATSIQQTSDGGYVVAGYTKSFGAGKEDLWILKLDSSGIIQWQKVYGGEYCRNARIQVTNDGGYIVAAKSSSGNYWILKLSSNGTIEWQKKYGKPGGGDNATSIQQTSDGGYVVAGYSFSYDFGGIIGGEDIWILKLDALGDIQWQRCYGGDISSLARCIEQTDDGGYIVTGDTYQLAENNYSDAFILKLDSYGGIVWQRTYGYDQMDYATYVHQTSDGGYIVGGLFSEACILKLDQSGNKVWHRRFYAGRWIRSIQQTKDGGYIIVMRDNSELVKLDSNGEVEWSYYFTAEDESYYGSSIQQTTDEGYVVAGYTVYGEYSDHSNYLVIKLDSDGDISQSCNILKKIEYESTEAVDIPSDYSNLVYIDTDVSPVVTYCQSQDTDAVTATLCEATDSTLTISINPGGSTDPAPGSYSYFYKTEVQVEAFPSVGYGFDYWSGDIPVGHNYDNPVMISMVSDISITANFVQITDEIKNQCFIATACYGTSMAEEVKTLCDFRDQYLVTNPIGEQLVCLYYEYSPMIANFIRDKEYFKAIVRGCLKPFIRIIREFVELNMSKINEN